MLNEIQELNNTIEQIKEYIDELPVLPEERLSVSFYKGRYMVLITCCDGSRNRKYIKMEDQEKIKKMVAEHEIEVQNALIKEHLIRCIRSCETELFLINKRMESLLTN